jgi:hypothetical protein
LIKWIVCMHITLTVIESEALTLRSPIAHPRSPSLTRLARCECLKRHGVGEREGELGSGF